MISASIVSQYLEGIDFPASKQAIINFAEDKNAPPEILDALSGMPDPPEGKFYSMVGVWNAIGDIE